MLISILGKENIVFLLVCFCFQSACTSQKFDSHFSPQLIPSEALKASSQPILPSNTLFYPRSIAVLLPLSHRSLSKTAAVIQKGFLAAYYQDKETLSANKLPIIRFYDVSSSAEVPRIYQKAIEEGAEAIVGPITKDDIDALQGKNSAFQTPTLVLNYEASSKKPLPNLFQLGLSPEDELSQLAKWVWKSGHHHAALFGSEDAWGHRLHAAFKHYWQQLGGDITSELFLAENTPLSETIRTFLYPNPNAWRETQENHLPQAESLATPKHRQDIDFIVFLLLPEKARQVLPLLNYYYAQDIPVYSISHVYSEIASPANKDLNGLTFCDMPWLLTPPSSLKSKVQFLWPEELHAHERFFALGFDAYFVIRHLKVFENNQGFQYPGLTGTLFLDEENRFHRLLPWAKFQNGSPRLLP